jgi:hypothetical protein
MKITLSLSWLWLFFATFFALPEKTALTGTVTDGKEPLIGATVKAIQNRKLIKETSTNVEGKYRLEIEPGTYDIEFSYTGFAAQRLVGVVVSAGKENSLDMEIDVDTRSSLNEVVVTDRRDRAVKKLGRAKMEGTAPAPMSTSPSAAESLDKSAKPAVLGKPAPPMGEARPEPALKKSASEEAYKIKTRGADDKETPSAAPGSSPKPRAGLLTAGEWNDLHNWNRHWLDLLSDGEIAPYQKMYSFYPRQRFTLMLNNENGFPVVDAVAQLKSADGRLLWEARTDNTGKAELWAAMFRPENEPAKLRAEVWLKGKKHELNTLKPANEGYNFLQVNAPCQVPNNVDIVWAVDATGSMGDEIDYLKTELLDVIGRAQKRNPEQRYRMGTVFYRDKGDEYLTKSSGLSSDIEKTVDFIRKQSAAGGGDYPEAVHTALEEAIFGQSWSETAIARICFLVLDASPHQGDDINVSLQKSIQEAAKRGIRIVPVAASGVQKDTEFLMKFFGLATNGSYVFLTDHSGIGGKHLAPTTDEYKVEMLNDLLVRLIGEYTAVRSCEGKSEIRFENDPQQQPGPIAQALYYPNPASQHVTLELPFEVQSVTLYDADGKAVRKIEKPVAGPNTLSVSDLAAGFYTIRILNNGVVQSGKLMVVRA